MVGSRDGIFGNTEERSEAARDDMLLRSLCALGGEPDQRVLVDFLCIGKGSADLLKRRGGKTTDQAIRIDGPVTQILAFRFVELYYQELLRSRDIDDSRL